MKKKEILLLSAAALLIVTAIVIVIRRRGRKVYLSPEYRLNENEYVYLYGKTLSNEDSKFFKGNLDYVVIPYNYKKSQINSVDAYGAFAVTYYPVKAIGVLQPNGKIQRVNLRGYAYINPAYLEM